jgi:GT2 family glycosyltransferase
MPKIAIGSSAYNNSNNIKNLVCSILAVTDFPREEYAIVACDDGSENQTMVNELEQFLSTLSVPLIRNEVNRGVPYSWNQLTKYYNCEYMIILNDDTRVIDKNWLKYITYFLDKNPKAGIVDWRENIISESGEIIKCTTSNHGKNPRVKLKPSGPFFAFRKNVWQQIKQPDGSIGFWEDLLAYREEKDIAAEFYQRGFYVFQLPFYMEHFKSKTFQRNPESRLRKQFSPFLPEHEYFGEYLRYAQLEKLNSSQDNNIKKKLNEFLLSFKKMGGSQKTSFPQKIEYSRALFAKKWKNRTIYNLKGIEYLENMGTNDKAFLKTLEKISVKFLDRTLREQEELI